MGFKLHVVLYDTLEKDFFFKHLSKSNPMSTTSDKLNYNRLFFFRRASIIPICSILWCIKLVMLKCLFYTQSQMTCR